METMEKDWHFFIAIAEEGNMTKAANRLYISQPALSYHLQQLEGTPLLCPWNVANLKQYYQ